MPRKRLLWQLFPSYLLIILIALPALTWHFSHTLNDFYLRQAAADLQARARLVEVQVSQHLPALGEGLQDRVREMGRITGTRYTVVLPSGEVSADSEENPARMENHRGRPEVMAALEGEIGTSMRFSHTLRTNMLYVSVPVEGPQGIAAVVRAALPATAIDRTLRSIYWQVALAGLGAALLAAAISLGMSRRISRPLEEIKHGAEKFARGDLADRLNVEGSEEIAALAEAMNRMAGELDDRIRAVLHQRNEREAVLSSMVEGVLAVDTDERIIRLNGAASRLLGIGMENVQNRPIQEVVRKADLQRFVARALTSIEPVEGEILLREQEAERYLQAHGTILRGGDGQKIGALVVLNDITRLRRLENVRRDFVANVSHELKTPITAIKGFVETLLDGALENTGDARRFLGIITRQADRLNAIIDDLLALSRIEQEEEAGKIPLRACPVEEVLKAAIQACAVHASAKSITIELVCPPGLMADLNPPLFEQAVVNLIDNAVKYSEPHQKVQVEAFGSETEAVIRVRDWGCGIAREHLPRLFERFYRVDKARSRKQGGTGLGLAIVKHIVQAHGGRISVTSTPGAGSLFTLHLPKSGEGPSSG